MTENQRVPEARKIQIMVLKDTDTKIMLPKGEGGKEGKMEGFCIELETIKNRFENWKHN